MENGVLRAAYGLYPHQRGVVHGLLDYLDVSRASGLRSVDRRVVAHLPTGAGKTRVASHVVCHLLNSGPRDERGLVIWLANAAELCEQACDELSLAWSHLGRWDAPMHRFWGEYDADLQGVSGGVLVAGLQKLWASSRESRRQLIQLSSIAAVVVFDEAHQAMAPTYERMVEALQWENPPLLGLTATPGRGALLGPEDLRLAELFRGHKVTIDPRRHGNPVTYLIDGGYLASPLFRQVEFASEDETIDLGDAADYGGGLLDTIGRDQRRFAAVSGLVAREMRRHNRVMVFCPSVENAVATAEELRGRGLDAAAVTGGTDSEVRSSTISRFRSREHPAMALLNYGVFTAGFDAPATSCVIVARPTASVVLYSQMIGRAMRGTKVGGNRNCDIWTVVDTNLPGFRSVADAFQNWEELWNQDNS